MKSHTSVLSMILLLAGCQSTVQQPQRGEIEWAVRTVTKTIEFEIVSHGKTEATLRIIAQGDLPAFAGGPGPLTDRDYLDFAAWRFFWEFEPVVPGVILHEVSARGSSVGPPDSGTGIPYGFTMTTPSTDRVPVTIVAIASRVRPERDQRPDVFEVALVLRPVKNSSISWSSVLIPRPGQSISLGSDLRDDQVHVKVDIGPAMADIPEGYVRKYRE